MILLIRMTRKNKKTLNIPLLTLSLLVSVFIIFALQYKSQSINNIEGFSGEYNKGVKTGFLWGEEFNSIPEVKDAKVTVLGASDHGQKWIEVDLSEQKLKAWDGGNLYLETLVATGLPWWPTPKGEFRIWTKLRYVRMNGGEGKYAYDLPNVPYTMFFENDEVPSWRGFGLHGTYWHNNFGTPRSHGCVNLPTPIAEKLYYWVTPELPQGKSSVMATEKNPGTRIVIHE